MTSSGLHRVHILNFDPSFSASLKERAPYLQVIVIPIKEYAKGPDVADLGDPEDIEVIFCMSIHFAKLLKEGVKFPNLKWVHTISAGVEGITRFYNTHKVTPHFILTRSSISSDSVAEYVIGQILANQRGFYTYHNQQQEKQWKRHFPGQARGLTLANYSVVLLGVGHIGKRLASLCKAFNMTVYGVTRSLVKNGHGSPDVDRYFTTEELPKALSEGDYIVNTLPSTPETQGLLDSDVLQVCQHKRPVFINVGRGDVISEDSVITALRSEWIGGAALDVFRVEPLPPDSLLWQEPNVVVTPHVAMDMSADTREKGVKVFLDNYDNFINGRELNDVINIQRGY